MADPKLLFVYTLMLLYLFYYGAGSMEYKVINDVPKTPGSIRYTNEIGIPYTKELLPKVTNFIWSTIFQQNNPADRKNFNVIQVLITKLQKVPAGVVAVTIGNQMNISSDVIQEYKGDVKWYFTTTVYHEATHIFQWTGEGKCPRGLVEGIAEYTQIKANYVPPTGYTKPGDGNSWDQGYSFTARFLEYCDGLVPGFVAKLNNKMKNTYDVSFFKELTGKPVEQLWTEYKAKYGKKNY
uniref:uncharacterized protein LOC122597575 n=1 Tax=Erigeron canadensis TaxID=72917 RepID=UPI001CB99E3B|nr:uncharacterized protein LOC122597575 [Erigeron canadensis]